MTNNLIILKDLDKKKDYAGIRYDIVIDDNDSDNSNTITLKNVDIVVHKVADCIDLFCFRKDQTKDALKKLEKYKSKEVSSAVFRWLTSFEYKIPDIPVRIIMIFDKE
ncbi:MAG: hypothetical protein LAN71_17085 [Acidobacteriia bacterium]|nr:hypothetical protein [Terriglobia bacterium]